MPVFLTRQATEIIKTSKLSAALKYSLFHQQQRPDCRLGHEGNDYEQACLFDANGAGNNKNLGALAGYQSSAARYINDNGQIVGWAWTVPSITVPVFLTRTAAATI